MYSWIRGGSADTWKKLYNPAPKIRMFSDLEIFTAQAIGWLEVYTGSLKSDRVVKGAGGAGLGWKYA